MKKYVFLILINIITYPKLIKVEREYLHAFLARNDREYRHLKYTIRIALETCISQIIKMESNK